uniref:Uncharacterized protein n=1 Tax=Arion vulgaris TaxID=1028688 RepID=A0A0B6Z720_9EUPU
MHLVEVGMTWIPTGHWQATSFPPTNEELNIANIAGCSVRRLGTTYSPLQYCQDMLHMNIHLV